MHLRCPSFCFLGVFLAAEFLGLCESVLLIFRVFKGLHGEKILGVSLGIFEKKDRAEPLTKPSFPTFRFLPVSRLDHPESRVFGRVL